MVRWIILAVLVVLVAATVPLAVSYLPADVGSPVPSARLEEEAGPPPKAVVEGDDTFDFGLMSEEDEGERTWVIRNEGEGPLRLRFAEKPCTCTGVRIGPDQKSMVEGEEFVIEPGERAEISLVWETRQKIGAFSTFARFSTNDYEFNPSLTLNIKGLVTPSVVVDPNRLDLGTVPSDEEVSTDAVLFSPSTETLAITKGPSTSRPDTVVATIRPLSDEELRAFNEERAPMLINPPSQVSGGPPIGGDRKETPELRNGYLLTLTVKPGLPLGRFTDEVSLTTDHPIKPEVRIPVSGQVVGPIATMPERVYMPGVPSSRGRSTSVTVNVRNHDRTSFTIQLPEALQEVLEASIDPEPISPEGAEFRQYRLDLRVPKGARPGVHRGTVVLKTDHPQAEEVKIPVEVLIRGG
ncbi:DUF1573 domain-containing protein [Tautonia sociabilis]|uniref:DUF1573 domain-containing protein n=1 Tax=Tautonia sociabilis TaxID=2080755 RepID=A0A432MJV5_9BACT|nr:DUF1573 domain-containing protein [Tautonia sociabilis]RUL87694.1 DUF1573 domain-containing protein [Tautonia sociabilis]